MAQQVRTPFALPRRSSRTGRPVHRGGSRLRFATFCSGIEGVSVAWEPLGMVPVFFSEIAPFPCAVLAQRWPHVPNLGDLATINGGDWRGKIDILWGSTPCQTFSFAGLRRGLGDGRGQLTLEFAKRVEEIDPTYVCWENVKGVLSDKNNAFGCLLGALAGEDVPLLPPGRSWPHAGYVLGPKRTVAWRLFDAQHGGVPQRRERVFVVAGTRDGADPRDILFECEGVRRDIAPRRPSSAAAALALAGRVGPAAGSISVPADLAPTIPARSKSGGLGGDFEFGGGLVPSIFGQGTTYGGYELGFATLRAAGGPCGGGSENLFVDLTNATLSDIAGTLDAAMDRGNRGQGVVCATGSITHALKAEGGDASEDGTGRGNPIIAFSAKDYGADASFGTAPTLRAMSHSQSHPNAGGQVAVAYSLMPQNSGRDFKARLVDVLQPLMAGAPSHGAQGGDVLVHAFGASMRGRDGDVVIELADEISSALRGSDGGGSKALVLLAWIGEQIGARVRRLMPRECERLQGLPDDHTKIAWRGKPADQCPDGPRYKAIGNGLFIGDVRWIGQRIDRFHRLKAAAR